MEAKNLHSYIFIRLIPYNEIRDVAWGMIQEETHKSEYSHLDSHEKAEILELLIQTNLYKRRMKMFRNQCIKAYVKFKELMRSESGQAMTEYGLIIALVGVVVIVAITAMTGGLSKTFESITKALGGGSSSSPTPTP